MVEHTLQHLTTHNLDFPSFGVFYLTIRTTSYVIPTTPLLHLVADTLHFQSINIVARKV